MRYSFASPQGWSCVRSLTKKANSNWQRAISQQQDLDPLQVAGEGACGPQVLYWNSGSDPLPIGIGFGIGFGWPLGDAWVTQASRLGHAWVEWNKCFVCNKSWKKGVGEEESPESPTSRGIEKATPYHG
jgi:hypothetical protein